MIQLLTLEFRKIFNKEPVSAYFCPGRINLIGEHLDYNGGQVLPAAIGLGTYLLAAPNNKGRFRFRSLNFNQELDVTDVGNYQNDGANWYNYPIGILQSVIAAGYEIQGQDFMYYGDIPIGTGLSSSASIEVVTAYALNHIADAKYKKLDLVKIAQQVENEFIGVNCGVMDQFAVAFGEKDKALLLDCNSLNFDVLPFKLEDHVLVIIDTNKPRKLSESKYNERVAECKQALKALSQFTNATHLCDITPEIYYELHGCISDKTLRKRARHVVEENDRVKQAAKALKSGSIEIFGQLMFDSHSSLRNLYEVTGIELDSIVDYCLADKSVIGARMTGAGFGGCAIALVHTQAINGFEERLTSYYRSKVGYPPKVYTTHINHGVHLLV